MMFLKHAKLTLEAFSCGFYFPVGRKCLINEHRYLVYLLLFSLYVNKLTFWCVHPSLLSLVVRIFSLSQDRISQPTKLRDSFMRPSPSVCPSEVLLAWMALPRTQLSDWTELKHPAALPQQTVCLSNAYFFKLAIMCKCFAFKCSFKNDNTKTDYQDGIQSGWASWASEALLHLWKLNLVAMCRMDWEGVG